MRAPLFLLVSLTLACQADSKSDAPADARPAPDMATDGAAAPDGAAPAPDAETDAEIPDAGAPDAAEADGAAPDAAGPACEEPTDLVLVCVRYAPGGEPLNEADADCLERGGEVCELERVGTVGAISDQPPAGCSGRLVDGVPLISAELVLADGAVLTWAFQAPGTDLLARTRAWLQALAAAGAELRVRYELRLTVEPWGGGERLVLTADAPERRAVVANAGAFADALGVADLPAVSIARGDLLCRGEEDDFTCTSVYSGLRFAAGDATTQLMPGESGELAGWQVHLNADRREEDGGGCDAGGRRDFSGHTLPAE